MANGDNSGMMIMVMMMIFAIGGAGVFLMMRKPKTEIDVIETPTGTTFVPAGPTYTPLSLSPSGVVFTTANVPKPAIPISGGSTFYGDVSHFAPYAINTCQCDENRCCYKGVYQPKYGNPQDYEACKEVYYGDPVDACSRAVEQYNVDVDVLKENSPAARHYYDRRWNYSHTDYSWYRKKRTSRAIAKGLAARIYRMLH